MDADAATITVRRDDGMMFGDLEGRHRHPEHFSRTWNQTVRRAIREGADIPAIRLHDTRHTHATILLSDREPVATVSQGLGHRSEVVTITVYAYVLPGDQKRAASRFAELVGEA